MSIKSDDLIQRIRDLVADVEIQRLSIVGLQDDIRERDERIVVLEKELSVLTVEPKVKANGG